MHLDPFLPRLVLALLVVIVLAAIGRRLHQPMPVVYIVAGIVLGPHVGGLLTDSQALTHLGEYGVILLLFLLGTEIKLDRMLASWEVPTIGLLVQVATSVASVGAVGWALDWPLGRIVLVGFAISLSSTAVVLRLLEERKLMDSRLGMDVLAILLAQDLALAPMIATLGLLGDHQLGPLELGAQAAVGVGLLGLVAWVARKGTLELPLPNSVREDPDLQVFVALLFALSLALVSAVVGLSAAFGAFVAGVVIGATPEERWVHSSLHPLRVIFVAVFLMAVGTLIDLGFLWENLGSVVTLASAALATNTLINLGILKMLKRSWRQAILGGALLSQVGEFSFVLTAIGHEIGLVADFGYQLALAVIATTLLFSAAWISIVSVVVNRGAPEGWQFESDVPQT